jgi:hypothetical protein
VSKLWTVVSQLGMWGVAPLALAAGCNAADEKPNDDDSRGKQSAREDAGAAGGSSSSRNSDVDDPPTAVGSSHDAGSDIRSVFASFNVAPDSNCVLSTENQFLPAGLYDFGGIGTPCFHPYVMHIKVSRVPDAADAADDGRLQIHSAEVHLKSLQGETLSFEQPIALANPFLVTSDASIAAPNANTPLSTIAEVEVIPTIYADQFDPLDGQQILAEIRLFATTDGGFDLNARPFVYPIELCKGCLTKCGSELDNEGLTPEDIAGDQCLDNAGSDGRICINDHC